MSVHRTVRRVGGSLTIIIPRDLAEMMGVTEGTPVSLTLTGRQLVIDPEDGVVREVRDARSRAYPYGEVPNARTRAAMRETNLPRFKSIAALMADLNADD